MERAAGDQDLPPTSKALVSSPGTAVRAPLPCPLGRSKGQGLGNLRMDLGSVPITSQAPGGPGIRAKASPEGCQAVLGTLLILTSPNPRDPPDPP